MKGGKVWRASSNGPDWTDLALALREVENAHGVWCSLRIVNGGLRNSNGLRIFAAAFTNVLTASLDTQVVALTDEWPNSEGLSLEAVAYRLILELDYKIGQKFYEQTKFPGT